jgi:hypothetical protein
MRLIPDKINGDSVQDFEWNPAQDELQNAVTSSNQVLNASDNYQIGKAMAMYSGAGDFYNNTGGLNTYTLIPVSTFQVPPSYYHGLRVRFDPHDTNTSAVTVNITGLASVALKKGNFNTGAIDVVAGDLLQGYITEAIYDATYNCFILSPASYTQIISISTSTGFPTGSIIPMMASPTYTPSGWTLFNDGSIGDASSGGTNRANADCQNLFILIWNSTLNTNCPVLPGGRGANASADWAAHKTINLPINSLRVIASAAGINAVGGTAGNSSVSLGGNNDGPHTHNPAVEVKTNSNPNSYLGNGSSAYSGGGGDNFGVGGTSFATASSGSGTSFNILQPTVYINYFIKL